MKINQSPKLEKPRGPPLPIKPRRHPLVTKILYPEAANPDT